MIPQPIKELIDTYFAIQILRCEKPEEAVKEILTVAQGMGIFFRRLELIDTLDLASCKFVKVRTDLVDPAQLIEALFASGRGYVVREGVKFVVNLVSGRTGNVPTFTMLSPGRPGATKMFFGTQIEKWSEQF